MEVTNDEFCQFHNRTVCDTDNPGAPLSNTPKCVICASARRVTLPAHSRLKTLLFFYKCITANGLTSIRCITLNANPKLKLERNTADVAAEDRPVSVRNEIISIQRTLTLI